MTNMDHRGFRSRIFAILSGMLLAFCVNASAAAPDTTPQGYLLGPLDKLNVRIAEWQTADATLRDWSAVSGEYTVGPDGKVSIPFVGSIEAAGKTTEELSKNIGDKLQQALGLIDRPSASVEIEQFRPVYVTGDVRTPGKYPYQPGLTVLKALTLAGGLKNGDNGMRPERDFINAKGDYDVLLTQQNELLARRARLQAETDDKSTVDMPQALKGAPKADQLMANENQILQVDDRSFKLKLKALNDLKGLLQSEITALDKKSTTEQTQLALVQKQLKGIGHLADQGLVVNSTVLNLQSQIADLQTRLLDIDTTSLKAKQDISQTDQDQIKLENDRDSTRVRAIRDTEEQLKEVAHKLAMNRDLMLEAVLQSTSGLTNGVKALVSYEIVRAGANGHSKTIQADESTPVLPGDVIKTTAQLRLGGSG